MTNDASLDDLDPAIWGPRPDPDEVAAAVARSRERVREAYELLYEDSIPGGEVVQLLGVSEGDLAELVRDGELFAVDGSDGQRFPAWQFDLDAPSGRVEGIGEVASAFPHDILLLSYWVRSPNPMLQGRSPRKAMLDGDIDAAVAAARAVGL